MSTVCCRSVWKLVLDTISTWANVGRSALLCSALYYMEPQPDSLQRYVCQTSESPNPQNLSWLGIKMKEKKTKNKKNHSS